MNGIIRVFPYKTSYTPEDDYVFIGLPPHEMLIPDHKEVHISCSFTWDKAYCEELCFQWQAITDKPVKLGGPAYGSATNEFIQGMYIKRNIIFTTRGCNNNCSWCCVPGVEGKLIELPILEGNIIQDNNFLQSSRIHKNKVFDMLRTQRNISFRGGLQADLIDEHFIKNITSLKISELWLACDTDGRIHDLEKACNKLKKAGFNRNKISCYVLIGRTMNMEKDEARCRAVFEAGAMPRAQLYREFSNEKTKYSDIWNKFERMWQRPAATNAHMKKNTNFYDYNKSNNENQVYLEVSNK